MTTVHPKELLQLAVLGLCAIWQSVVVFLSLILFLLLVRLLKLPWWFILATGLLTAIVVILLEVYYFHNSVRLFLGAGYQANVLFWKVLLVQGFRSAFYFQCHYLTYMLGFPWLVTGILSTLDLIPRSPHEKNLQALYRAQHNLPSDISNKQLDKIISRLPDAEDGVLLGVSKQTGQPVVVPDHYVNQVVLLLGTTGSGKTITLRRFYQRAMQKKYPLIIVDGKPTQKSVEWVMKGAQQQGQPFYGFNCAKYHHYNPLAQGGHTELKDKIISLKDHWESDYYKKIAEDYLQTTFEALLNSGQSFDLKKVTQCLDYTVLAALLRRLNDKELIARVQQLEKYPLKDISGLQAHLNLLIHSEVGKYFEQNTHEFCLSSIIKENAIAYFAFPALRFLEFAPVLGKLIINDMKAVIDREESAKPIFTIFDEFSVFAGKQVLNLVNMGREKGIHAVFGTQGLADLDDVTPAFKNQMLNCANTLICHRLNDQESAETISTWIGTEDSFDVTAQITAHQGHASAGSISRNRSFIVHPDDIKQHLATGEAYYVSKVNRFQMEKIKVKLS
jgi:conjugal transfer pilus assembly protein TraD